MESLAVSARPGLAGPAAEAMQAGRRLLEIANKEKNMDLAMQGAIWLGAGVTLVMLLSRRRRRRVK